MARTKLKFRLHRAVIVLFCLALLVALMQGASWFSQNHQRQRNPQLEELARTLARQVTLTLHRGCVPTHRMKNAFRRSSIS